MREQPGTLAYRPDIDGLRALAVLSVVIYHAGLGLLPGGFVGVDVFFVISGYLIASIILREHARGDFSLARFYERRIRRIFPALAVVIAFSAAAGAVLMTPADYVSFAKSAIAAMAFYSNLHFDRQAGYFTPAADTQPLLHTWSLGVEEQFYLVAPFILIALAGRWKRWRAVIFWTLFAASLGVCVWGVAKDARWAFYLPHARAFELMCGAALALGLAPRATSARLNEALAAAGVALIVAAALLYSESTPFPGVAALAPALGAAILIQTWRDGAPTLAARTLSWAPVVYVGKISYSLYLWHWPLLAFGDYAWGADMPAWRRVALLLLALALSALTYRFIEQPARAARAPRRSVFAWGAASIIACAILAHLVTLSGGWPQRLSPQAAAVAAATPKGSFDGGPCWREPTRGERLSRSVCFIGAQQAPEASFALWGDSHAAMLSPLVKQIAGDGGFKGYHVGDEGCPPLLGLAQASHAFRRCGGIDSTAAAILSDPAVTTVLLMARWARYAEGAGSPNEPDNRLRRIVEGDAAVNRAAFAALLQATVARIRDAGKRVIIIGPTPEFDVSPPSMLIRNAMRGRTGEVTQERRAFDTRQNAVMQALNDLARVEGVRVIFTHPAFCDARACAASADGDSLYFDFDHLSAAGLARLAPALREAFRPEPASSTPR